MKVAVYHTCALPYVLVLIHFSIGHLVHAGVWNSPPTTGTRPPPCSVFSLTKIDCNQAVLFGGLSPAGWINDVHIIDLQAMVSVYIWYSLAARLLRSHMLLLCFCAHYDVWVKVATNLGSLSLACRKMSG